jgi:DNA end-binding protein Ku
VPTSFWTGTVSFGLVTIPVRLATVVQAHGSNFHLLHDADHARLTRVMVCPVHETPVPPDHQTRGYEIEPDTFVPVSYAELDSVAPEASRSIEIEDFVTADAIDPVYHDRPYYLTPSEEVAKPYRLLVQILADTGRVGIGRFVLRGREHLAALRAVDGALCLVTLHWAEAVRPRAALAPKADADEELVAAMTAALDELATDFDPARLTDPGHERLQQLVEKKRFESGTVEAPVPDLGAGEPGEAGGEPDALMAALQKSLERARAGETGTAATEDA